MNFHEGHTALNLDSPYTRQGLAVLLLGGWVVGGGVVGGGVVGGGVVGGGVVGGGVVGGGVVGGGVVGGGVVGGGVVGGGVVGGGVVTEKRPHNYVSSEVATAIIKATTVLILIATMIIPESY